MAASVSLNPDLPPTPPTLSEVSGVYIHLFCGVKYCSLDALVRVGVVCGRSRAVSQPAIVVKHDSIVCMTAPRMATVKQFSVCSQLHVNRCGMTYVCETYRKLDASDLLI